MYFDCSSVRVPETGDSAETALVISPRVAASVVVESRLGDSAINDVRYLINRKMKV
jgi:hypothetical protein